MSRETRRTRTIAIHEGESPDPSTGASSPNLVMSTTYMADPEDSFSIEGHEGELPFIYTRWSNPTVNQLEKKLAALEGAEACLALASGMAAVNALFTYLLRPGDHLVIADVSYAATAELSLQLLPELGVQVDRVNMADLDQVRTFVSSGTKLVYIETPCNPIVRLTDIEAVAKVAHEAGALLAVDSTLASPIATRPLELGADYVIHSLTKYFCGHGDALGGGLFGSQKDIQNIRKAVMIRTGGCLSPFNAWLIMRGVATLPLRMIAHENNALEVARFLEDHPKVQQVIYPGLASHPQHDLAKRQMQNFSGMIAFQAESGRKTAKRMADHLEVVHYAVSLGHHRSLIFYMPTQDLMSSSFQLNAHQEEQYRRYAGDGFFRFSVGLEDPRDICTDIGQVLDTI